MALIEAKNVGRTFGEGASATVALKEASLTIEEGEFIAIMGASGSGKSTLMHILGLLDRQSAGSYLLKGKDTAMLSDAELAHLRNNEIGFVFQVFHLLPRISALQNVFLPLYYSTRSADEYESRAKKVLEQVGLGHRLDHEPSEMSGGERQRVALARALINDPKVVFADEPTGNLDSKRGKQIMDLLAALHKDQGRTVIVVTHEEETAAYASRRIVLKDGVIISDNKTNEA